MSDTVDRSPAQPRIEAFTEVFFDDLLSMWRESFEAGVGIADPHSLAEQAGYFRVEVMAKHRIQVALAEGKLLGFCAANDDSVAQLYVRVGHHRQGIGKMLLDWAKARSGGTLWLYTFERNTIARAFYESQGFQARVFGFEPFWQLADVKYEWSRQAEQGALTA
jgi:ribosomal protein S18 acetylase RimI-like enzyme